jgi:hypothetical protein
MSPFRKGTTEYNKHYIFGQEGVASVALAIELTPQLVRHSKSTTFSLFLSDSPQYSLIKMYWEGNNLGLLLQGLCFLVSLGQRGIRFC